MNSINTLTQYLPHDPIKAILAIIGAAALVILVAAYTAIPAITWLLNVPVQWCAAGRPVLPAVEQSRETFLVD